MIYILISIIILANVDVIIDIMNIRSIGRLCNMKNEEQSGQDDK